VKKRYLVGVVLCCLMIIPLVGCGNKGATSNTSRVTPKTPMQILTERANQSDLVNNRQDTNLQDFSNRITGVEARVLTLEGKAQIDLSPLTARVTALEGLNISSWANVSAILRANISDLQAANAYLATRIGSLESYNISTRLLTLENGSINTSILTRLTTLENMSHDITSIIGSYNTSQLLTIFHNLLNLSTGISIPSTCETIIQPNVVNPQNGNMSEPNTSVRLEWNFQPNASGYEVYLGINTDSTSMALKVSTSSQMYYQTVLPDTIYFWKVIALSNCGNKSSETWWFKTQ